MDTGPGGASRSSDVPLTAGTAPNGPPLIVTLAFDDDSFAFFDGMRKRYFPAARNFIPAHLTLFHHLPGNAETDVAAALRDIAAVEPRFRVEVSGVRFLGYGSAFGIESRALLRLHAALSAAWADLLMPQDRQHFQPHVTIQNKASARDAKALFAELDGNFRPFGADATGLLLWRYRNGPWEPVRTFAFAGNTASP